MPPAPVPINLYLIEITIQSDHLSVKAIKSTQAKVAVPLQLPKGYLSVVDARKEDVDG